MDDLRSPASESEREKVLEGVVTRIAKYRLQTPAVLLLEMHKPLRSLAWQATHFVSPLLAPILGVSRMEDLAWLFSSPDNLERLIAKIEASRADPERGNGAR